MIYSIKRFLSCAELTTYSSIEAGSEAMFTVLILSGVHRRETSTSRQVKKERIVITFKASFRSPCDFCIASNTISGLHLKESNSRPFKVTSRMEILTIPSMKRALVKEGDIYISQKTL
jgi:hypothetical protein